MKKKAPWDETIRTMVVAVLVALAFRSILFEPFHIPSGSMKSNLLVGDYLFVSKYTYGYSRFSFPFSPPIFEGRTPGLREPQRGDVVVFRLPRDTRVDFIKRIMGMPGDRIQIKSGVVHINGQALPRTPTGTYEDDEDPSHIIAVPRYSEELPEGKTITILKKRPAQIVVDADFDANNTPEYTVPEGHYFMMGDNRDNSRDSRFLNEVGFVPKENIVGRAEIIFFSVDTATGSLFKPWTWPMSLRYNRFLHLVD